MSDPQSSISARPPSGASTGTGDRLRLKTGPRTGEVDGGWWPRSLELAEELPALAAALADRIGAVSRIAFALDGWRPAPRRTMLGGHVVRLEGFHTQDARLVHVTGSSGTRLSLRLVPPDTAAAAAAAALDGAAGPAPDPASGRWEDDGGPV